MRRVFRFSLSFESDDCRCRTHRITPPHRTPHTSATHDVSATNRPWRRHRTPTHPPAGSASGSARACAVPIGDINVVGVVDAHACGSVETGAGPIAVGDGLPHTPSSDECDAFGLVRKRWVDSQNPIRTAARHYHIPTPIHTQPFGRVNVQRVGERWVVGRRQRGHSTICTHTSGIAHRRTPSHAISDHSTALCSVL